MATLKERLHCFLNQNMFLINLAWFVRRYRDTVVYSKSGNSWAFTHLNKLNDFSSKTVIPPLSILLLRVIVLPYRMHRCSLRKWGCRLESRRCWSQ